MPDALSFVVKKEEQAVLAVKNFRDLYWAIQVESELIEFEGRYGIFRRVEEILRIEACIPQEFIKGAVVIVTARLIRDVNNPLSSAIGRRSGTGRDGGLRDVECPAGPDPAAG